MPTLLREKQPIPAHGMIDEAVNTAPQVPSSGSITDGYHMPELDACSAVLTTSTTVETTEPDSVQSAQQWPVLRDAQYELVEAVRRSITDRSFHTSSVIRIQTSQHDQQQEHVISAHLATMHVLAMCDMTPCEAVVVPTSQYTAAPFTEALITASPSGQGGLLIQQQAADDNQTRAHVQQLVADDNQTRSEQGGQLSSSLTTLRTDAAGSKPMTLRNISVQGMQAVDIPATKKQLTFRAFVLSLRGAGRKRPYSQEQYTASSRTQPLDYYDVWDMAEGERDRVRDPAGLVAHTSITQARLPHSMVLSHEEQQQILNRVLTKIGAWATVNWSSSQSDEISRTAHAALQIAMRQNQNLTASQLKKAIEKEANKKAYFINQKQQEQERAAQRRALPGETELATVLAAANLPAEGPGGMVAAQVHQQNQAAAIQYESSLLDRVIAQRSSTFPDAYRLYRGRKPGLVLTKEPHKGLTNTQVRLKEIEYLTNNGVLLVWATQKIDEIITGLKLQLADGDSD